MFTGLENPVHLLFIAVLILLVFGPKRLPEMGRSLGSGLRNFKDSISAEPTRTVEPMTAEPLSHDAPSAQEPPKTS